MEGIREAALAYYETRSEQQKKWAWQFFKSMDVDGDDRVSLQEFMKFLRERNCPYTNNPNFFRQLDKDGDGSLDFHEVITLYYIVESKRPACDGCGVFIPSLYFTCVTCHECNLDDTFDLCSACYRSGRFNHAHTIFADNFLLLAQKRLLAMKSPNKGQETNFAGSSSKTETNFAGKRSSSKTETNYAGKLEKVKTTVEVIDAAVNIGSALSECNMM